MSDTKIRYEQLPWAWHPSMQSETATAAIEEYHRANGPAADPHDPAYLMCLDKLDLLSRYQLLLGQKQTAERTARESHETSMRRLVQQSEAALKWWEHCRQLRVAKRKTAHLADMPEVSA